MVAAAVILKFISIIAMVLGLALQSTLGDVFSGLSLSIEKPYSIGDEIALEGGASNDGLGRSGESLVIGRIGSGHRYAKKRAKSCAE
jgi:small-conductance mechanosensitive channel